MKLLIQIPVNGCVFSRKVVNDKSSVNGILFFMPKGYKHKPENYVPFNSRLKFIKRTLTVSGGSRALYECSCGNIIEALMGGVKKGRPKSCGCYSIDYPSNYKHGLSNDPLYAIWENMKARCYNKQNTNYPRYGAIGVYMCQEWLDDPNYFIEWAKANGWNKSIEVDKDYKCKVMGISPAYYSPETCTLMTKNENSNYKRTSVLITYEGVTKSAMQWSKITRIPFKAITHRYRKGWPLDKIFSIKPSRNNSGVKNNKLNEILNNNPAL